MKRSSTKMFSPFHMLCRSDREQLAKEGRKLDLELWILDTEQRARDRIMERAEELGIPTPEETDRDQQVEQRRGRQSLKDESQRLSSSWVNIICSLLLLFLVRIA